MYFIIIALIVILDQLVKYIVQSRLDLNQTIPILEDVLHLTYIHNNGAAFSILENMTGLLIFLPLVITVIVLVYIAVKRRKEHGLLLLSLALIAAGGIGNLIDRISYGYVVDYIDFRVFPIFNVADISVTCGCGLLIIYMFFVEPRIHKERNKTDE